MTFIALLRLPRLAPGTLALGRMAPTHLQNDFEDDLCR